MKLIKTAAAVFLAFTNLLPGTLGAYAGDKTAAESDAVTQETKDFYAEWKEKYVMQNPYTDEVQYFVCYGEETYEDTHRETEVTVSESHGYGMLIAASMAQYDKDSKELFDGMYRFYSAHTSEIGPHLMAWQQADNGTEIINVSGADSATDGDMDIAYSLLMADYIWGSSGEIDYKQSAVNVINDIMTYEVNKSDWILQLGDWAYELDEGERYYAATRASDFIVQYMPVFAGATGDDRWLNVYDATYNIINSFTEQYGTGILPDFIVKDNSTGKFVPAPANFLESENDGNYYYNSCRTPWRIGMDYLVSGNTDALNFANKLNDFIIASSGGDPWEIMSGFTPDGKPVADWNDLCFVAPFMITAACGNNTQWHDEIRDVTLNYGEDVYYGDTIKMLCLIVDDGGWIVPEEKTVGIIGDVNADGAFSVADIVMMQNWLLGSGILTDWKAGDLCEDNIIDSFDLCLMKQQLIETMPQNNVYVSDSESLQNALNNAAAGDTIILTPGIYESSNYGVKSAIFRSASEGTSTAPITIKSADAENPAILKGTDISKGIVLYITGDYWNIENIVCCNAQKGIVLDNSNYSEISGVEVYDTGQEGIHLRDGSSYCVVDGAKVHDNGLVSEYGEAVYIGSAKSTSGYAYNCDNNTVKNCILGPNTVAESVDIKEYTTGNIIENCTMYGSGMTATDSFVDIKGNENIIRNNTCYAQDNTGITDGFQLHCQVDGWGKDNTVYGNTVYFAGETEYVVRSWSGTSCTVYNNIRNPENSEYMYRAFNGSTITVND